MALLEIENLTVEFATAHGAFRAVDDVSISVDTGDVLAIVGESGSGKSVSMLAVMGLLPWTANVTAKRLAFEGRDLLGMAAGERRERAVELMRQVGIPAPERRLSSFPHQLSGGMNQRVMIAIAIACNPRLLIADEPTTALDVTIQAQILDLLLKLQQDTGMALVLITHDMGVVAETAQRVAVFYAGQKVEQQPVQELFGDPHHPYTAALLAALPERAKERLLPSIPGVVPGQFDRPPGCLFAPRCKYATPLSMSTPPPRQGPELGFALCHYPLVRGRPLNHPAKEDAA